MIQAVYNSGGISVARYRQRRLSFWPGQMLQGSSLSHRGEGTDLLLKSTFLQGCTQFTRAPCWKVYETSDTYKALGESCGDHFPSLPSQL